MMDEIRRAIVDLDDDERREIAVLKRRNLDRYNPYVVWDTVGFWDPVEEETRLKRTAAFLAFGIVIAGLVLLGLTIYVTPEYAEYVSGVFTTLTGTVAGFIG